MNLSQYDIGETKFWLSLTSLYWMEAFGEF